MAKRLVKGEKKLFGVCSGLANYLDIDPTLMRALFIIAVLMAGTGVLAYIVLAIIMPDK
ncbi:MAG TPA: PspC domain-containing protein [Cyclobacteriaceae bacterium]|jgi:phage shock protein PspC (stress-responsive transcriptional regulator)|nr:PspC domain-containing protein [Cyclobacteriaceae bacterium]HNP06764.1 PspC domain-containing protein [Cyclobacteriaceae bacterium]HRK53092.1 PspC domain-containing protein [Cyclobacteriaceae bacterium]